MLHDDFPCVNVKVLVASRHFDQEVPHSVICFIHILTVGPCPIAEDLKDREDFTAIAIVRENYRIANVGGNLPVEGRSALAVLFLYRALDAQLLSWDDIERPNFRGVHLIEICQGDQ